MYVFLRFFQNPKKHDFLRFFELLHTFSRTMVVTVIDVKRSTSFFAHNCSNMSQWVLTEN